MIKKLKGLDTLRAIAALVVVIGHIELLKKEKVIPNLIDTGIKIPSGHIAVVLFFVLSGFLITYLLVKEREKTTTVSLKKFYLRRILRIWPLYFLIILLSLLFISSKYTVVSLILCLTIFPNVAHAFDYGWRASPQIWSIGVEEQFYLFWPIIFILLPEKRVNVFLILFFIGWSLFPYILVSVNAKMFSNNFELEHIYKLLYGTKFNCMAIGAFMGFSLAKSKKWITFLSSNVVTYSSIIFCFTLWFLGFEMEIFEDEFYSIIFSIMIVSIVSNPKIIIDTKISRFLGQISYGIYMYHWIIIVLILKYFPWNENLIYYNVGLYITIFFTTIVVSWLSHNTVEKYFLNLKENFKAI